MKAFLLWLRKWLLGPLLPFLTVLVAGRLEHLPLTWVTALFFQAPPTPDLVKELNRTLAAFLVSLLILLAEVLAEYSGKWKSVTIHACFQLPRESEVARSVYVGRMEEDPTLLTLVVETHCRTGEVRELLHRLVPDLQLQVTWLAHWISVASDVRALRGEQRSGEAYIGFPVWELLDEGKGRINKLLYLSLQTNEREQGSMGLRLYSQHRFRLILARLLLLRDQLGPVELRLKQPALPIQPARPVTRTGGV